MSGKITALTVQKKNKERVSVFLDGQFAFGLALELALTLKKGQYLDDETITRLIAEDEAERAYQHCLRFLSYRARSQQEVEQYLGKKGYAEETIPLVVERLSRYDYLDDAEFARIWVRDRENRNPKGKQALRHELRRKGVAEADIEQALTTLDEEALARRAIHKRLRQWRGLDEQIFRQKLSSYLARRGFDYEVINAIFYQVWAELNSDR